jgi:hypothetical protein
MAQARAGGSGGASNGSVARRASANSPPSRSPASPRAATSSNKKPAAAAHKRTASPASSSKRSNGSGGVGSKSKKSASTSKKSAPSSLSSKGRSDSGSKLKAGGSGDASASTADLEKILADTRTSSEDVDSLADGDEDEKRVIAKLLKKNEVPWTAWLSPRLSDVSAVEALCTRQEREYEKMLMQHDKALQAVSSSFDANEAKLSTEQVNDKSASEAEQREETEKLRALHADRLASLDVERLAAMRALERQQQVDVERLAKESAARQRSMAKDDAKLVKRQVSDMKKNKALGKSERKDQARLIAEKQALVSKHRHEVAALVERQKLAVDQFAAREALLIEHRRIELYYLLIQTAQVVQLGNRYTQQRHWKEMEQSTQLHKLNKQRTQLREALQRDNELERRRFECDAQAALFRLERAELERHLDETHAQRQRQHDARKADSAKASDDEVRRYGREAKASGEDANAIRREQNKMRQLAQKEQDKLDSRFQREQVQYRKAQVEILLGSWRQKCRNMVAEQRRRYAVVCHRSNEMRQAVKDRADLEASSLQKRQVTENDALQTQHVEARKALEANRIESILTTRRDQSEALKTLFDELRADSAQKLADHQTELEVLPISARGAAESIEALHSEHSDDMRQHANEAIKALRSNQELLWTRWTPPAKKKDLAKDATPNAELNDESLAAFLSGTTASKSSASAAAAAAAASSSSSRSYVHGRTHEEEYIERIALDTGLGEDLIADVWKRIGGVRESEIYWN